MASWLHGAVSSSSNNKAPISHSSSGNSAAPCFAYSAANTSAGLPHVQYDVCGALGCQGKTPQVYIVRVDAVFPSLPVSVAQCIFSWRITRLHFLVLL